MCFVRYRRNKVFHRLAHQLVLCIHALPHSKAKSKQRKRDVCLVCHRKAGIGPWRDKKQLNSVQTNQANQTNQNQNTNRDIGKCKSQNSHRAIERSSAVGVQEEPYCTWAVLSLPAKSTTTQMLVCNINNWKAYYGYYIHGRDGRAVLVSWWSMLYRVNVRHSSEQHNMHVHGEPNRRIPADKKTTRQTGENTNLLLFSKECCCWWVCAVGGLFGGGAWL